MNEKMEAHCKFWLPKKNRLCANNRLHQSLFCGNHNPRSDEQRVPCPLDPSQYWTTKFLEEHPGGEEVLMESAGKDATEELKAIGHSKAAQNLLLKYQVGILLGANVQEGDPRNVPYKESKGTEMTAFVLKDYGLPKCAALLEFIVPLLVVGIYLGYRLLS